MRFSGGRTSAVALVSALLLSMVGGLSQLSPAFAQHTAMATTGNAGDTEKSRFRSSDSGSLAVLDLHGKQVGQCPLKHTSVTAKISGYVASVTVKQIFDNPFKDKIEAVYTFPLSDTGAVDEMIMKVGTRTIRGTIKRREEARKIYEDAKAHGNVASLLDQERPNIFTQSVANIKPGEKVEITLRYVDLLPYEAGSFSFAFPTVVGPRFNPGAPTGTTGTGWSPNTTAVPDASKITPPVTPAGTRAGHDLSIAVSLDAAVPIEQIQSALHEVVINRAGSERAEIALRDKDTIPNKDFVLTWKVAGDRLKSGYLTHKNGDTGYFTLMVLPPKRVTPAEAAPKEMVFLIDCSGSQSGAPLQKAKETMQYILDHMNPRDSFQVICFNNQVRTLFDKPRTASPEMKAKAKEFIGSLSANGGTWMAPAVEAACSIPADEHRLRIVTFMTDGYVGNDFAIIGMVRKLRGTSRWFPFGTGNSVNRMLINGIAQEGGGEPDYVLLNSPGDVVGKKFYDRIASPVLTDVQVDWDGLSVKDVFPHQLSDVWAERPLYIKGAYTKAGHGTVTISGFSAGKPYQQKLELNLPEKQTANEAVSSVWARAKVDRLMSEDLSGAQRGAVNNELKEEIIKVALDHHIMTQYTSFVAVEETVITDGGTPRTVAVPVEMPDGVSREGVFGKDGAPVLQGVTNASIGYGGGYSGGAASYRHKVAAFPPRGSSGGPHYGHMAPGAYLPPPPAAQYQSSPSGAPSAPLAASHRNSLDEGRSYAEVKPAKEESPADKRKNQLETKLSKELRELASATAGSAAKTPAGLEVKDGKVTVQVWLTDSSDEAVKKLEKLGLKVIFQASTAKMLIGTIDITKLEELAQSDLVRLVEPAKFTKK